jgi:hypothetical protein
MKMAGTSNVGALLLKEGVHVRKTGERPAVIPASD